MTGASDSKTDFGSLTGTFVDHQRHAAKNDDLQLKSGLVPITGAGTVSLPARTVNYRVTVSLAGAIGVPVLVTGPWDNLSYRPDVGGMLKGAVQEPGKALEQLKKLAAGQQRRRLERPRPTLARSSRACSGTERQRPEAGLAAGTSRASRRRSRTRRPRGGAHRRGIPRDT